MRSEDQRTPEEVLIDKALLLALFSLVSKESKLGDIMKAQKLSFLAAAPLFWQDKKAFSLEFYRYNKGPISNGVYAAIDDFAKLDFIRRADYTLSQPSARANQFAEEFINRVLRDIPENSFCYKQITDVVENYARYSGKELKDKVYKLSFSTVESQKKRPVEDVPHLQHFTYVLDNHEAKQMLSVPDDWMDTLALMLNPANYEALKRAEESPFVEL